MLALSYVGERQSEILYLLSSFEGQLNTHTHAHARTLLVLRDRFPEAVPCTEAQAALTERSDPGVASVRVCGRACPPFLYISRQYICQTFQSLRKILHSAIVPWKQPQIAHKQILAMFP